MSQALKEIEIENNRFRAGLHNEKVFADTHDRYIAEHDRILKDIINKYGVKSEVVETYPNGISKFRILDADGSIIAEYHDIKEKQHGGIRLGAGRPSTGRKKHQYYVTDEENIKIRELIEKLRKPSK